MNPFLFLLAMVLGFSISWFLVVKTTTREVPLPRRVPVGPDGYEDWSATATRSAVPTGPATTAAAAVTGAAVTNAATHEVSATDGTEPTVATHLDASAAVSADADRAKLPASVPAPEDGSTPPGYAVKGDTRARLYLQAGDPDFERAHPDIWFRDTPAAVAAGYGHYERRG